MDRRYYQTGGITMANTLQQNLATNRAQASNIQNMLNEARRKAGLPTVQSSRQTTAAPSITTPTQTAAAPSITTPTQTTAAPMRTSQSTQAPTLRQISSAILSGGNPMASPTQTSTPSMQQVTSQMMAPTTASKTYTIPKQSGPGMGPMMADPLQVFSGLNQQQLQAQADAERTAAYEPQQRLQQYGAGLGQLAGFASPAPAPTGSSPFATGLSTAMGVAGLFGKLYG